MYIHDIRITRLLGDMEIDLYNHCMRVMELAEEFYDVLNLDEELLVYAAAIHDIGKSVISSQVMGKPTTLNAFEKELMDMHSYFGYRTLQEEGFSDDICLIVLYHHGKGKFPFPESIPECPEKLLIYAEVLRTIDAFDALTDDRPYRDRYRADEAIDIMEKEKVYNSKIIEVFKEKYLV